MKALAGFLLVVFVILCFTVIPYGVQILIGSFLLLLVGGSVYGNIFARER